MLKSFNIILKIIDKFYKNNFYLLCAVALVLIVFDTFSVISIYPLIQVIINNSIEIDKIKFLSFLINLDNEVNTLIFILVVFLCLFTLKFVFSIISNFMISNFKMNLQKNLSKTLLRKYLKYNLIDFISLKHSELIRNITKETEIMVGAAEALIRIVVEGLVLIFIISIVFYSFPEFTLFVILFFSFGLLIFYFFFRKKITKWGKQRLIHDGLRIKGLNNTFELINEIKLLGKEEDFVKLFNKDNAITQRTQRNRVLVSMILRTSIEFGVVLIFFTVLMYLNYQNNDLLTILPMLGLIFTAMLRFLPGIMKINNAIQIIMFAKHSLSEIYSLLVETNNRSELIMEKNPDYISMIKNKIELSNVSFKYDDNKDYFLNKINVKFETGDIIGISGGSGEGKSTLLGIIAGLIKPNRGTVGFNGINIDECLLKYRGDIGYVSQNFSLIDSTLVQNITLNFSDEKIEHEKLLSAINLSGCNEFVDGLDQKLETELGQSGFILSGGQKQRVALARAIYNSNNLLLFDEATTSLDKKLSGLFFKNLPEISKNKIVMIVSHQNESFEYCNKLFELKDGKLNEIPSK